MDGDSQDHEFSDLTVIDIDGDPWFVAHEVCKLLDIRNPRDAVASLDDDEKLTSVIPTAGQNRSVNLVSESGLYALIFRSKKPSAKKFRKWVTKEVIPTIRKKGAYNIDRKSVSNFILRYDANFDKIENGYFSVIGELFMRLHAKLYALGYSIPDKSFAGKEIRPDTSVGRLFSNFLKKNHPEYSDKFKYYKHYFPAQNVTVEARQYENIVWPSFVYFVDNVWIPEHAEEYFKQRDLKALDYLPKLLPPKKEEKKDDTPFNNSIRKALRYNPREEGGDV